GRAHRARDSASLSNMVDQPSYAAAPPVSPTTWHVISVRRPRSANVTVTIRSMLRSRQTSRSGSTTSRKVPPAGDSVRSSSETIVSSKVPPVRTSMETVDNGVVKPRGPNQRATCSGSVHASHTSSRGASKTRVIVNSRPMGGVSAIAPLLDGAQVIVEPVEAALEELPVALQPAGGVLERTPAQPGRPPLGGPPAGDEPGVLEHLQVLRNGLHRHGERLRELVDGRLPVDEPLEDRPARGIGESREGATELVDCHG